MAAETIQVSSRIEDLSTQDRIFSLAVRAAQNTLVKAGVLFSNSRKQAARAKRIEDLSARFRSLHLDPERLWWGAMTLAPSKIDYLLNEIERQPPRQALEVGAGTSTAVLAAAAEIYDFPVLSLENHGDTVEYVDYLVRGLECAKRVEIQLCGFTRGQYKDGRTYRWYNADLSHFTAPVDFVLIDGPMSSLVGRNGALPEILPYLHPDHRIIVDDCKRAHEKACIEEWKAYYPGLQVHIPAGAGVFCVQVPEQYLTPVKAEAA